MDTTNKSESARKGWKNRNKQEMVDTVQEGYRKWREENPEQFLRSQKEKAQKSKLETATRLRYNGETYLGWRELKESTGVSKHRFLKYKLGTIL